MNKMLSILTFFLLCSLSAFAQKKTESFQLPIPKDKIVNSLYNSIRVLDIRRDTTNFGIVQKGAFNRKEKVIAKPKMAVQFSNLVKAVTNHSEQKGKLLLLLRQCSFAEVTGSMSEKGYFLFRAILFAQQDGWYKKIASIDTLMMVKALDVTHKMFRHGTDIITHFVVSNLSQNPKGTLTLSRDELALIDSVEKSKLPLYTASTLADGIYDNFQSFVNQQPDEPKILSLFNRNGEIKKISYINKDGDKEKVKAKQVYAIVYHGKPYIATKYGYYPLLKKDNNFYFTGKTANYTNSDIITAELFFGVIGGLLAQTATSIFEMKLDHLSGGFIRIKEVIQ